jgi:purine-cytosine permease-like protein
MMTTTTRLPTGVLSTYVFGMTLRDASLSILFFSLLCAMPPAYMGCGGYKTGMRQMIQARYSWGLYVVIILVMLNAATITGFALISAIVGGQTLAAINPGQIDVNVGIVIVILVSFTISLAGMRALHAWERWSWIPNIFALLVTVGYGGRFLRQQVEVETPVAASSVLSFGGLIAGYFITFGGTVSDFSIYHNPNASK